MPTLDQIMGAKTLGEALDLCRELDPDARATAWLEARVHRRGCLYPFTKEDRYAVAPLISHRISSGPDPNFVYRFHPRSRVTVRLRRDQEAEWLSRQGAGVK